MNQQQVIDVIEEALVNEREEEDECPTCGVCECWEDYPMEDEDGR